MSTTVDPPLVDAGRADRRVIVERLVVVGVAIAVLLELVRAHAGVSAGELAASWQLLDRDILEHDLLRGLWYLHTQPPLHNAVVGTVLWSPFPPAGTLFALYGGCLVGIGLLVHDLTRRWGAPGWVAAAAGCLAVADPPLLSTIHTASYEVPLALLLLAFVAVVDRHLAAPRRRTVVVAATLATVLVLTRALFHPAWLAVVLAILLLARPMGRRTVLLVVAMPVLAIGAVIVKNAAVVDRPTLSTWTGFNMQRGVVGPMDADAVADAIEDGAVTSLAAEAPWQDLPAYAPWLAGCRPRHDHPALAAPSRVVGDLLVPNFNHECYLPLYDESADNAQTMIRRQPGRYVRARFEALALSFAASPVGIADPGTSLLGERLPGRTWMDLLVGPLLLHDDRAIEMTDWNVAVFGERLTFELSWTLALLAAIVAGRTIVALGRVVAAAARREPWSATEVSWLLAGGTIVFVVVGGDLVELGENGRFRAMLDPLLIALAVRVVVEAVHEVQARRSVDAA